MAAVSEPVFRIKPPTIFAEAKLWGFISNPVIDDLTSVPGIGCKTADKLAERGIMSTTQLIGTFLTYKRPEFTMQQHFDAFYGFLVNMKIGTYAIEIALAVAEKANTMIPGIFDSSRIAFSEADNKSKSD